MKPVSAADPPRQPSRLDVMIARLLIQRGVLNHVIDDLRARGPSLPGPLIELGLGNGRTYHHLRQHLPERRILVFDRAIAAHPDSRPGAEDTVLGDISETGPAYAARHPGLAAFVHADLGRGVPDYDGWVAGWLPAVLVGLVCEGGWVATSIVADHPLLARQPLPDGLPAVPPYALYRRLPSR